MNSMQENRGGLSPSLRVLIAEGNDFFRCVLSRFIEGWSELEPLDSAADGCSALKSVSRLCQEFGSHLSRFFPKITGLEPA
jgi:CheY-like chemotaxis protein